MKKLMTIIAGTILMVSMIAVAGMAQPFGAGAGAGSGAGAKASFRGHPGGPMNGGQAAMRGLMRLDLTDAQRDQILAIMQEHREVMLADCDATSEEMKAIRDQLRALNDSDYYDEDAARDLLYRKFEINTEKQILRQKVHHRILWEVLDAEQRETLAEQRANAEAFGRGFRQGRSARGAGGYRF